jgi:hypothetical protein
MPRRLPVKADRFMGNLFIVLVFTTLVYIYYVVIVEVLGPKLVISNVAKLVTGIFHFFVIMLLW